jgi:hypothetical protein
MTRNTGIVEPDRRDDLQRELGAMLADVSPSARFAAGVHGRIAESAGRTDRLERSRRAWMWWTLPACASVAIVAVFGWMIVKRQPMSRHATQTVASAVRAASVDRVSRADRISRIDRIGHVDRPTAKRGPDVLVPGDQSIALVHYLERLDRGQASVPQAFGSRYDNDGMLVDPAPVVITPLPALAAPADAPRDDKDGKVGGAAGGNLRKDR